MRVNKWIAMMAVFVLLLWLPGCARKNEDTNVSESEQSTDANDLQVPNEEGRYTVTFYSNDGTILKMESVAENTDALPPVMPQMTYGTVFVAWDTGFTDVTENLEVYPICADFIGKSNVFAVTSVYGKNGDTVVVPIQLCGNVCTSGFDIIISYDAEKLELKSIDEDSDVVYNAENPGVIRLNYVSAENTTADIDVCFMQFALLDVFDTTSISVEVKSICAFEDSIESQNDSLYAPGSNVINGQVHQIP